MKYNNLISSNVFIFKKNLFSILYVKLKSTDKIKVVKFDSLKKKLQASDASKKDYFSVGWGWLHWFTHGRTAARRRKQVSLLVLFLKSLQNKFIDFFFNVSCALPLFLIICLKSTINNEWLNNFFYSKKI